VLVVAVIGIRDSFIFNMSDYLVRFGSLLGTGFVCSFSWSI